MHARTQQLAGLHAVLQARVQMIMAETNSLFFKNLLLRPVDASEKKKGAIDGNRRGAEYNHKQRTRRISTRWVQQVAQSIVVIRDKTPIIQTVPCILPALSGRTGLKGDTHGYNAKKDTTS